MAARGRGALTLDALHRVAMFGLAFAIGCAGGDSTIDRTFDPCAFSIADAPGVEDALALWGVTASGADRIELVFEDAAPAFHGFYDDEAGVIYINQRITDPRARAIVIAHELGHAFGLPHIEDVRSVMNRGNLTIEPTVDDRAAISSCAPPRS